MTFLTKWNQWKTLLSDYLGQKFFFIKSARFFAYGFQFTYLTMPCCFFFRQFAFHFWENRSQNIEESLNGVHWSETKGNHYVHLPASVSMCYMAQVIKAHAWGEIWYRTSVQVSYLSLFFLFFCFFLLFVLLYFCLQEKPICQFKPPNNASQICWFNAGFDIFPLLDNPSWTDFFF